MALCFLLATHEIQYKLHYFCNAKVALDCLTDAGVVFVF